MSKSFKNRYLRRQVCKPTQKDCDLWRLSTTSGSSDSEQDHSPPTDSLAYGQPQNRSFELQGRSSSSSRKLNSEKGFATVLAMSLLPLIFSMGLGLLLTQYLTKNWMQSLHICRTELLKTQKETIPFLQRLLDLNPAALSLRVAMRAAQLQLAGAVATQNSALVAATLVRISQIRQQQTQLDQAQRYLVMGANERMSRGLFKAIQELRKQNAENQKRLPRFFSFTLSLQNGRWKSLAVRPKDPDLAPSYELESEFEAAQALSISWKSHFQLHLSKEISWPSIQNSKKDACAISISESPGHFQEIPVEDKH